MPASISPMLETHPHRSSHPEDVARCADAAFACVEACKVCADACLSEERVSLLTSCIRLNLDCAEVCAATGSVVLRIGRTDPQPLQAQLAACIEACRDCPDECRRHAATHAHCRLCAEACDACRAACETMMATMRHAGESEADTR